MPPPPWSLLSFDWWSEDLQNPCPNFWNGNVKFGAIYATRIDVVRYQKYTFMPIQYIVIFHLWCWWRADVTKQTSHDFIFCWTTFENWRSYYLWKEEMATVYLCLRQFSIWRNWSKDFSFTHRWDLFGVYKTKKEFWENVT